MTAAYNELGDWERARDAGQRAVQLDPTSELAKNNLAKARRLLQAGDAARGATDEPSMLQVSLVFFNEGAYSQSIDASRRALQLNPRSAAAFNNICSAFNALRQWNDAIAACQQALQLAPDYELARNNLRWAEERQTLSH